MTVQIDQLEQCITRARSTEAFSGVVSLMRGSEVLFERAYGLALRSEAIPNRVDTRFQIASGCKIFTSVAIAQLIERGQLEPHSLLADCAGVPLPHFDPGITVQHLLTHTSGIPDYFDEAVMDDYEALWQSRPMYTIRTPADFLPLFQDQPMRSLPGTCFAYNNAGFIVLGLIIEQRTGMSFAAYVNEHIFQGCGMVDSGYFAADQLPERVAYSYIQNPDGSWRSNIYAVPVVGGADGGAYTTARDMARFWQALLDNTLLRAEATGALLRPQVTTGQPSPYTHYGYGVWIDQPAGHVRKLFVEGSDPGVAFRSGVYPEHELILTLIGNSGGALWPVYHELEQILAL